MDCFNHKQMNMKTLLKSFMTFSLIIPAFLGFTQNTVCGTDYFYEKEYQKNPSFQNEVEQNWMVSDSPIGSESERGARAVKIIPVVFHVFHDNGVGNISYDQILSAMDMINEDFRRTNADTGSTRDIFKPYATDSEVEFRLALVDPNGNCTNGVVRINDPNASRDATNSTKPVSRWPSDKYFNIWVVNNIESSGVNGIILGYAQFPGSGAWNTYGVIIRHDRVGSIGTAISKDRTLTHEIGHCLNLLHTFQSGCGNRCQSSGDRVCDTPPVDHSTQACNKSFDQCSNDASGNSVYNSNVPDQIENYMSYNDCQNMFSIGQKSRMQTALANFSTLANLVSTNNIQTTGVFNTNPGICKAEFKVTQHVVCVGQNVQFKNQSYFNPKSFSWSFEGGFPTVSTDENPTISYTVPGTYRVELSVVDSNNVSVTTIKSDYITVLSSIGKTAPFVESFENIQKMEDAGWYGDLFSTGFGWELSQTGGASGVNAIKANAYSHKGKISVISAAFDASNLTDATVSFKYAYAAKTNGGSSYLRVYVSGDCGQTWRGKLTFGGSGMVTVPQVFGPYNMPEASHWATKTFTVESDYLSENTRIKFEFNSDDGNNLFIDNINMNGVLGEDIILKWPYNGDNNVSVRPTLNWNATSAIDYYKLEMDTDTLFNTPDLITEQFTYINSFSNGLDTEFRTDTLVDGETYFWRVTTSLNGIDTAQSEIWSFTANSSVTGIENVNLEKSTIQIFPNPANEIFTVSIHKTYSGNEALMMYDITGNLVQTIHQGYLSSGISQFQIHRNGLSNGVYLIQSISKDGITTKRVILE